jgi:hypothetical protein
MVPWKKVRKICKEKRRRKEHRKFLLPYILLRKHRVGYL